MLTSMMKRVRLLTRPIACITNVKLTANVMVLDSAVLLDGVEVLLIEKTLAIPILMMAVIQHLHMTLKWTTCMRTII
jgi:hypothetical protein